MGTKAGMEGRIASFTLTSINPFLFINRLQKSGLKTWKAAKKHKALRPFAWIYRICCVCQEINMNQTTIKEVYKSRKAGLAQRKLIKRLGLDSDKYISDIDEISSS